MEQYMKEDILIIIYDNGWQKAEDRQVIKFVIVEYRRVEVE